MIKGEKILSILAAVLMVFVMMPAASEIVHAEEKQEAPLSGDVLNGCKVRIRPAGGHQPLSINEDGYGDQNCVHLFVQGKSSQFYLQKKDDDSYLIYFYTHYRDAAHKTSDDCRLDIDNGGQDSGYYKEGQVIHVVSGNADAVNKRWQFIPQGDGTYYIRNKLSGQYWSLDNLNNINKNNNKLVQRKTPMKWAIEIVEGDNDKLKSVNDYDSRNFEYNGKTVKSTNWMGALPGSLKITDISIPGTHDSGACNLHTSQDTMSTQRYYIDELLNSGVRHLDVRTGLDDNNTVRIVHSSCHARNRSNQDLKLSEAMDWIYDFLDTNPTETVIFQVKVDAEGDACERETFRYLEALAKVTNSKIWAGDHVPALDEVRGRILIISRLTPDKLQGGNFDIVKDGKTLKWALDCHDWKDSYDQVSALTAQGTNYEVWTQDNWNRSFSNKKTYVRATLFGKIDGYTNGTMYRYDRAKQVGKDAWVFNYTSANNGGTENPYQISKDMHQWIYDSSDYSKSDRLVCKDTFTGVMAFDYMDGLMAAKIYKTNFNRQYITVHGVTADGKEPVDPLTLFVGDESESITKLKNDTTRQIIKAHFNTEPYQVIDAESGEILSASKASDSEAFDSGVSDFDDAVTKGSVGSDLYVHLEAPIREAGYEVEMPLCKTDVSAEDPKVTVFVDDGKPYETIMDVSGGQKAFITENADSDTPFSGTVEGGTSMPVQIYLKPKWGYRFSDYCTVTSDFSVVAESEVLQNGQLKIKAEGNIPHSADRIDEVPASCESGGVKEHYYCEGCKTNFFSMTEMGDSVQVEASDEELSIPALGHDWGEWEVKEEPTSEEEGLKIRKCKRENCKEEDSTPVPVLTHVHDCTNVKAKEADNCSETGNIEYWVCDQGSDACHLYFSDAEYKNVIKAEETKTTAGKHDFGEPHYAETWYGNMLLVTAVRECKFDSSHRETEMAYANVDYQAPTCTEGGYQHVNVDFKNKVFNYETREEYPALGHEWGEAEEGKVVLEPTCSTAGVRVLTCKRCGESKTEEIASDPDAHMTFTEEDEKSNTATCTEGGRQTQYEICSLCDKVIETRRISTEPLGHKWSEVAYKWAEDDSAVTAARICERDGCSESESETAETSRVIYNAGTFQDNGIVYYDAEFKNEAFGIQEKTETIPKLAEVKLSDSSYTYTGEEIKPAVILTDSEGREIDASNYSLEYSNNIDPGIASVKVILTGDLYEGEKSLTFNINEDITPESHTHITFTEVDEKSNTATCTEGGRQTQYEICSLCDKVIETRRISTEPLGHKWGEATYKWAEDDSAVTAARVCERDGCSESEFETVKASRVIYKAGTFRDDGKIQYNAKFSNTAFAKQEKIVNIPKVAGVSLSASSYTYSGKQIEPEVVLTDSEGREIDASNYSLAYSRNVNAGSASVNITLKGDLYEGERNLTFKINKAANPLKIKGKTAKVKYSKLKKKGQKLAVTKVIRFRKKLKDKKRYSLVSAKKGKKSFKKYFKINKKTGKVTIKKNRKMKKGTYKIRIKVKALGNANYKASAVRKVTFKIKVR